MSGEGEFKPFDSGAVPRYQEIATFMRAARAAIAPPLEIALAGVPLDLGATYRVGARHGPAAVREASRLIRQVNPATGIAPFQLCKVADVGDAPTDPLDVVRSVALIQGFFERIHGIGAAPLAIGGDHTVPLPILRAIAKEHPVGLIQFDAHGDVFDEFMGSRINHATFVRRGIEEGLIEPAPEHPDRPARHPLRQRRSRLQPRGRNSRGHDRRLRAPRPRSGDRGDQGGRRRRPGLRHLRRRRARPERGAGHRGAGAGRSLDARQPGHAARADRPRGGRRRRLRGRAASSTRPASPRSPPPT